MELQPIMNIFSSYYNTDIALKVTSKDVLF